MAYILCVDDEESISGLISKILAIAGHEVTMAHDGQQALEAIARREPDLIVLDRTMPYMDGLAVCRTVKANPFTSRIPVLMLTAQGTVENKVEGYEAGADDYLVKPFEPRELTARVHALLRLVRREGDRNPSSGLPGGRAIAHEIERRIQAGQSFAVIYFDLDYFKPFADTFGFSVADDVIHGTGALLGEMARENGAFAGHIGGDDFLLITTLEQADAVAHQGPERFVSVVARFVGPEIAAKGHFSGLDRDGQLAEFPLARMTAVIVPVSPENWLSVNHLGEAAASWKKAARAQGAGQVVRAEI